MILLNERGGADNENMASSSTLDDTKDTEDLEVYPVESWLGIIEAYGMKARL